MQLAPERSPARPAAPACPSPRPAELDSGSVHEKQQQQQERTKAHEYVRTNETKKESHHFN